MIKLLAPFTTSSYIEVQERSNAYLFFLKWQQQHSLNNHIIHTFRQLFHSELMPLHPNSQQVIAQKIPKELDLDKWIGSPFPDSSDSDDSFLENIEDQDPNDWYSDGGKDKVTTKKDKNFIKQQSVARKQRQTGPWYIGDDDDQTNEQKLSTSDIE